MTAHIVVRSIGDEPATMSREILHDLLRDELGFDGHRRDRCARDEGDQRRPSASRRARCGRSLPAPTRCASVTTCSTSPSSRVRDALVDARSLGATAPRSGSSRRPGASPTLAPWAVRAGASRVDRDAGRAAARRALRLEGEARLDRPALVVELVPEVGMAAGRLSQLPGEWFRAVVPDAEVRRFEREP